MFLGDSFSDLEDDFQIEGLILKSTSKLTTSKTYEKQQGNTKSESVSSQTSQETTKSNNFRFSRSKYVGLIDESDIKWWTNIQAEARRLAAGKDDLQQHTTAESIEIEPKVDADLNNLCNEPICCPIMNCKILFWPNDLMLHFLSYHNRQSVQICKVFEKQRLLITLAPFQLNVNEVSCVGVVSYAGKKLTSDATSANKLWIPQNLMCCKQYTPLMYDYPILVLASIVPLDIFIHPKPQCEELSSNDVCASMFVLWLAGAQSNANIFCTITSFNDQLSNSQSGIYNVRTLTESQCPREFCKKDCNYFRLNFKELYALLRDEKTLQIELVFQQDLDNTNKVC